MGFPQNSSSLHFEHKTIGRKITVELFQNHMNITPLDEIISINDKI